MESQLRAVHWVLRFPTRSISPIGSWELGIPQMGEKVLGSFLAGRKDIFPALGERNPETLTNSVHRILPFRASRGFALRGASCGGTGP
jgi:hypothetical protein